MVLIQYVKNMVQRHSPILGEISTSIQHEGESLDYSDVEGNQRQTEHRTLEAGVEMSNREMKQGRFADVFQKFDERMAKVFALQQEKHLIEEVSRAAEGAGNVTHAAGSLTKEVLLEALDNLQWEFDPATGAPHGFSLLLSAEALEAYRSSLEEWQEDPGFLSALEAIEEQKRAEWNGRESRRRLVD